MKITNFQKLIEHQFADLYDAEQQLAEALPKLAKASTTPGLKKGFEQHLTQTENHIKRLEEAAELCDFSIESIKCKGVQGLIEEGTEVMESVEAGPLLDAALIGAGQKAERYEMAAYGSLISHLMEAGFGDAADILSKTLAEEEETDAALGDIAASVNPQAASVKN